METSSVDYICAVMRRLGMIAVRIEFSGAGDSGNVDDLTWEGMCDLAKTPVDDFPVIRWRDENGAVQTAVFDISYRPDGVSSPASMRRGCTRRCAASSR